jgi:predicted membrane protein
MTSIDDTIRRALSADDLRAYEELSRAETPLQATLTAFRTQHAAFAIAGFLVGTACLVLAAYAVWRAAEATEIRAMLGWAGVAAFGVFFMGILKLWFWMEMQKNSVVREVKRLELQVASLVALASRS